MLRFLRQTKDDKVKFTLQVTMEKRWVPYFMSMLKCMETYGKLGCSREVGLYSDGDGDFRPKFNTKYKWDVVLPKTDKNGNRLYDAG